VTSSTTSSGGCCGASGSCFAPNTDEKYAQKLGYSQNELTEVPEGANLGLGCGNPTLFANLKPGEVVLDLGSGAGFDAFIAARAVGQTGRVIGVDMTPEMVAKARQNSTKNGYKNVEFRLGEIEYLPIADSIVDVIISNCVINLVPNKAQVFREAFRVLRSGGRIAISDVVTSVQLPESVKNDLALYAGCLSGATLIDDLNQYLSDSGFVDIKITPKDESREFIKSWAPNMKLEEFVVSALIEAKKP
jgi:ubiquinone/menaquinone biosynthesis C-methylase UbiE